MSAQRLATADLHWAAGFLDGEGSFTWADQNNQLTIAAGQNYPHSLEKLKKLFGGNLYPTKKAKPSFRTWRITSVRAAGIMMTLYTLLSPYRQGQIQHALAKWKKHPTHLRGEYKNFNNSQNARDRKRGLDR